MSLIEDTEIKELMEKKQAGTLDAEGRERLFDLLTIYKEEKNLPAGIAVAAGIVLANLIVRREETLCPSCKLNQP